ncbi:MAPEG family protein [Frigidibacter sp. RF13]|uniref:MAPEG family protein n=1 Tax=Frigidibacter sp. RF13 TaxID=2997340 RepID=UPI00226DE1F4|nr:MAPEG family protein [Frigidibacter sp. RF13]MCY1126240.1 MAPEG family protein [Frigidibacter sp. RF13]
MTPELTVLALAALLQMAQLALFAAVANRDLGAGYTTSPRDRPPSRQLSILAGRLQRAVTNHFEGLILFTIATLVVTLGHQSTPVTQYAAWTYLGARLLYIPAYALGLRPWRSAIWGIGFFATLTMIGAALFP